VFVSLLGAAFFVLALALDLLLDPRRASTEESSPPGR
jgi:hypothetical protein